MLSLLADIGLLGKKELVIPTLKSLKWPGSVWSVSRLAPPGRPEGGDLYPKLNANPVIGGARLRTQPTNVGPELMPQNGP